MKKANLRHQTMNRPSPISELGCLGLMGIFFLFCSLTYPSMAGPYAEQERYVVSALSASRVEVQGVVTKLYIDVTTDVEGGTTEVYCVDYRYQVRLPGGDIREYEGTGHPFKFGEYASLQVGQPISIVYAASDPSVSTLPSEYPCLQLSYILGEIVRGLLEIIFIAGSLAGLVGAIHMIKRNYLS